MGSLFRSQDMTLCQLYLQTESAYAAVSELGELGALQFKDLNQDVNVFQRKFVNEIRRCEEMERQLRYFEKELKNEDMEIFEYGNMPRAPGEQDIVDFEATFESLESQLKEVSNNIDALARNFYELLEMRHVLSLTQDFFFATGAGEQDLDNDLVVRVNISDMVDIVDAPRIRLEHITGVIHQERLEAFMKLLWRACRGMTYLRFQEIPEYLYDITLPPDTSSWGADVRKVVFTVFFQGDALRTRVKKICEGFRVMVYPCPSSLAEREEMLQGINTRLTDLDVVIKRSQEQRRRILDSIANKQMGWMIKVHKVKAIYHTLNMFRAEHHSFIAEGWCPTDQMETIQGALNKAGEQAGSSVPSLIHRLASHDLPTFNRTNKFTKAFQAIIDAYGIATYKEVNPAPFAIITFPFLFSVMFGDTGHGLLMTLAALWMLLKERTLIKAKSDSEIWNIFFNGRYLIFMMGLFSMYSGLIYNDTFSKSLNVFGSSWSVIYDNNTWYSKKSEELQLDANDTRVFSGPYPFGLDPVWQVAKNKIMFTNSYKKKISVIFGVAQMLFGLVLSATNHVHRRRWIDIFTEFVPQIIFISSIFLYLVVQIFAKWVMFDAAGSMCSPSLLIGLINMAMFKQVGPEEPCSIQFWFTGQYILQLLLLLAAIICVPWMLLIKPLYMWRKSKSTAKPPQDPQSPNDPVVYMVDVTSDGFSESTSDLQMLTENSSSVPVTSLDGSTEKHNTEFDLSEVLVHQMIHTIEFCLGCISHTASYLRLWALSLAHAQLSEVLWTMVFRIGLRIAHPAGFIVLALVFAPWAVLTVAILLLMEGLSAFLHTLRLHWVEFQSKFYKGEGFPFVPFNFDDIMTE